MSSNSAPDNSNQQGTHHAPSAEMHHRELENLISKLYAWKSIPSTNSLIAVSSPVHHVLQSGPKFVLQKLNEACS
jgi:hypothetical protein